MKVKTKELCQFVDVFWDDSILPTLIEYIQIPNKSPMFDPDWQKNCYMEAAVTLAEEWCRAHIIPGNSIEVVRLPDRTPVLFLDIPGTASGNVLLYGYLDKQPEMTGWRDGLGPWQPVIEDDRLYGRGGADDGYALFSSVAAILGLRDQGASYPRSVVLIECCEESGSFDLPHYIDLLYDRIGKPDLVVCLDSGCGNYDQLWCTTSLRGLISGNLIVEVLSEGVHSGDASGIVPSSFRIARQVLSRIENEFNGEIIVSDFHAEIPAERIEQAQREATLLQERVYTKFPFVSGAQPVGKDHTQMVLNRTWHPALEVTGAAGLPSLANAGNVLRPLTTLKLSLRLPPTVDAQAAAAKLKVALEQDAPYAAHICFELEQIANGWNAPAFNIKLMEIIESATLAYFGNPTMFMGEGGSIPFMQMLASRFPEAQFLVTGVLGPQSNAHGPNEFLHIPTAKRLTSCIAHIIGNIDF
ncbi:MAG: M20/M25/M40 family metallo-hydrolase [Methylococcaceae bacterium]|jgi:acetylornithine deacetylase/succinyl-diaminopimelate desuccinylase-like protein